MTTKDIEEYFVSNPQVPKQVIIDAFKDAIEIIGTGYVPSYYWAIACPIVDAYKRGVEDGKQKGKEHD